MSAAIDPSNGVISTLKDYLLSSTRLGVLKQKIIELYEGKRIRDPAVLEQFKSYLRTAMGKDEDWAAGNVFLGQTDLDEEEQELWNKRESIRSQVS